MVNMMNLVFQRILWSQLKVGQIYMSHSIRQFRALTKKNFISWMRQPGCAVFQLICPGLLMLLLVWIRTKIKVTETGPVDYDIAKRPFYPGLEYSGGVNWNSNNAKTSARQSDFMVYDNYTNGQSSYNMILDLQSPLYFLPDNCNQVNSVILPKVESPVIAVVGPSNIAQDAVTSYFQTLFPIQKAIFTQFGIDAPDYQFKNFASIDDLNTYVSNDQYFNITAGYPGVCFGYQITGSNNNWNVQMLFNDQTLMGGPNSTGIPSQINPSWTPSQTTPKIGNYYMYSARGYSALQNIIANVILKQVTNNNDATISLMTIPEPSATQELDTFSQILSGVFPLLLLFMYIMPVFTTVSLIVKEKESKAKESMRMMGMTDAPYWLSWFAYYTILNTIFSILAWAVLCINVIGASNPFYIFLYIWLYGQSVFGEIIFMQSLFSKSKFSGLISAVIYFTATLSNIPVQKATASKQSKAILSLIPQVASQQIAAVLAGFESANVGIHSDTVHEWYDNYTFREGLICLILSGFLFTALGLYLDKVLPKEYGVSLPFYFLCTPQFYGCRRHQGREIDEEEQEHRTTISKHQDNRSSLVDNFEAKNLKRDYYEPVAADVAKLELDDRFLKIDNLQKTYQNGFKAVKGINVKMFEGQIFALLGQNGAGKTTTISMLTGLLPATAGKASVFNKDVFRDMQEVRRKMGVCPQHDVLFEALTPLEHLDLFFELKGGNAQLKEKEIADIVRDVGLTTDKDKQSGSLSGGNKRKLSVSIALIGQSKLVLLDEPTSGMDLSARRALWNMLRKYRRDRIIILTTHYMDEADVLGDRIGIMAHGQLKCLGSSLFLKNKFGGGYKLIMVKKLKTQNKIIEPFLKSYFGDQVEKLSEVSSEITFMIPKEKRNMFQDFFKDFDQKLDKLELESYGIGLTTLEEVFLAVNADDRDAQIDDKPPMDIGVDENQTKTEYQPQENGRISINEGQKEGNADDENLMQGSNIIENNYALLIKRAQIYRRDFCGLLCELVVPFVMVLIGCGFAQITFLKNSPPRILTPDLLPLPQRISMNIENVIPPTISNQEPSLFYQNLPSVATSFELTQLTETDYYGFYNAVFDQRLTGETQPYRYGSYQIYQADGIADNYQINVQLNTTSQDVTALYPQFIYESVFKTALNDPTFTFTVTTQPFPVFSVFRQREKAGNAFDFAFMVGIGLSLIPTVIVSFILKEREENLKHMQLISGMNKCGYWLSNMIADIVKAYLPIFCILILAAIFNTNYDGVWVLYLLFPPAIVLFSYTWTFFFAQETSAQITIFAVNFLISGVLTIMVFTLQIIPQTVHLGNQLRWWFCLVPAYCVTHGIVFSSSKDLLLAVNPDANMDNWAFKNLLGDALALVAHFVIGLILLAIAESDIFQFLRKISVQPIPSKRVDLVLDNDVLAEETRVQNQVRNPAQQNNLFDDHSKNLIQYQEKSYDVIRVSGFRKAYTTLFGAPFLAVERISFGLDYGECFALLGVNGAGKSSTFKSLTGDTLPTTGEITIQGFDIQRDFQEARKLIGYCPQKDAIFSLLTVEEHLWFYSRLKGVPTRLREKVIEQSILEMNLREHRTKPAGTLSGGNKRKLSVAIATLGNPPIILLDEPSAGMDPEARRFMWSVVEKISQRDKKSAVILTTHSMEEAEALSTKMGIMVRGGVFKCFGSSQHIKNKYGTGFEIQLKIRKANPDDIESLLKHCGFSQRIGVPVNLNEAISKCKNAKIDNIILEQIKEEGLGSDLATEAAGNSGNVILENLLSYLFVQKNGLQIIDILARIFNNVEMIEQCADFYKLKVPRDETIGYLFGLIEDKKEQCNISEYSVTQTSLEQIFQNFAQQEMDDIAYLTFVIDKKDKISLLNPDRRSTFVQKKRTNSYQKPLLAGENHEEEITKNTDEVKLLTPRIDQTDSKPYKQI